MNYLAKEKKALEKAEKEQKKKEKAEKKAEKERKKKKKDSTTDETEGVQRYSLRHRYKIAQYLDD